jgi:hypothetical protein
MKNIYQCELNGWHVDWINPSIMTSEWEHEEDLLTLSHNELNRLIDVGWYEDRFIIKVIDGKDWVDDNGELAPVIGCATCFKQSDALDCLIDFIMWYGRKL